MAGLIRTFFFLVGAIGCVITTLLIFWIWPDYFKSVRSGGHETGLGVAITVTVISGIIFYISAWVMLKIPGKIIGSATYQAAAAKIDSAAEDSKAWAERKQEETRARAERKKEILRKVASRLSGSRVLKVVVQGGSGWQALSGKTLLFSYDVEAIFLNDVDCETEYSTPLSDVRDVTIGGPGTVVTGGGAIGGGVGAQGFIAGAAAAAVLNLLTTHKSTKTLVRISTAVSELFLLVSTYDPDEMRRYLSPVYTRISGQTQPEPQRSSSPSVVDELLKLDQLRVSGVLSPEEFDTLKARILCLS